MNGYYYQNVTDGVTLAHFPATIDSDVTISNINAPLAAVNGPASTAWFLTNLGMIRQLDSGYGISFAGSGTIINELSGYIFAYGGVGQVGIFLLDGGYVINGSGGTIRADYGVKAEFHRHRGEPRLHGQQKCPGRGDLPGRRRDGDQR